MKNPSTNTAPQESYIPPDWDGDYQDERDLTCKACGGDGRHPMDDCMPCPDCDGEGYEWWMA